MYPVKKKVKAGGLLLLVAGILLVTACKSPVGGGNQGVIDDPSQQDKASLIEEIAKAQALLDSLAVSENGTDIEKNRYWVISKWALECAIDDAQEIVDSPDATAEEIQLALEALTEAYNAANNAKQRGTKTVDKSALGAKIAEAEALAASLQTAANGDNIPPNEEWVTAAEKSKLTGAIQAAKAVAADENAVQDAADSALAALTQAYNEANSAKKKGTTPNKTALIAKIAEAAQKIDNAGPSESGDGSEWKPNQLWVSVEVYDALQNALSVAEQARDYVNATKVAVDAALANLTAALGDFNPEPGISMADKTELNAIIRHVEAELARVQVSDNGQDVYDDLDWVTAAEKATLETALHEAQGIAGDHLAEQEAVDAMTETFEAAFSMFNPQAGKKAVDHLDFYVTFTQPEDETITLGADQIRSWADNSKLQITVKEAFTAYQWYVDGAIKNSETGNSITLFAGNFARNSTHTVTVKVTKGGVPYTKTLIFTVE